MRCLLMISFALLLVTASTAAQEFSAVVFACPPTNTVGRWHFWNHEHGMVYIDNLQRCDLARGDRVRIRGSIINGYGDAGTCFGYEGLALLDRGVEIPIVDVTPADIYSGQARNRLVRATGVVLDAFRDETYSDYTFLILACGNDTLLVSTRCIDNSNDALKRFLDATVSVVGYCFKYVDDTPRAPLGYEVSVMMPEDITILSPAPAAPFSVPLLGGNVHDILNPKPGQPLRRKLEGSVLAVWQHKRLLLALPNGKQSYVELSQTPAPRVGDHIEAAGLPETDFYHLNLSHAIWRTGKTPSAPLPAAAPLEVAPSALLSEDPDGRQFNVDYNGQLIRLTGKTLTQPGISDTGIFQLQCGLLTIPIDTSGVPGATDGILPGTTLAVTGICVMEAENWRPQSPFPHIRGLSLIIRSPEDLVVLARPSWWTTRRLLSFIGALLAALLAILGWNLTLRRLIARKGRELMRKQLDQERLRLSSAERTRLAVELHDTISQNLTGIALQLGTAANFIGTDDHKVGEHLDFATRALISCRRELKNCIWDLRNGALDKTDLNQAVRRALAPYVDDQTLSVRLFVRRAQLSESLIQTLISVIRELVCNAVRHGQARHVRVAGAFQARQLQIAVTDDGIGFDPQHHPGVNEGHYGLQGIEERLLAYHGTLQLESAIGSGTRAVFTLALEDRRKNHESHPNSRR